MAFFSNDAVNRVNLHYGVMALAMGAGGAFFIAFLLHAGVSVPATLATFAAVVVGRFALRPAILPLAKRWGLKPLVVAGVLIGAGQYPLLAEVHGINVWLYAFGAVMTVGDIFYWPCYHAYFAAIGDPEHRGHQIGAREALAAVVGVVAPLLGAWALVAAGPRWAFAGVALVQVCAALPLIGAPNVAVKPRAPGSLKASTTGVALFVADGWLCACILNVWQVMLFVSLGKSLAAFGGAVALAALVGAAITLAFGRQLDRGHGRRMALFAYGVAALVTLLRAASYGSPWLAVVANAAGALVSALVIPAMMTAVYNIAKSAPCPFRFHMACEGGWDIGCAIASLIGAGLAAANVPLYVPLLVGLPGAAASAWMLARYYAAHPSASAPLSVPAAQAPLVGEPR
ncbi:MAG: MFS transporter [Caulobacteraceae bacterium]